MMLSQINSILSTRRLTRQLGDLRRKLSRIPELSKPFYIIAMPGGLHLAKLATEYLPSHRQFALILNGTAAWERRWASQNIPTPYQIPVGTILPHWQILDALFDTARDDFGILDYDCYVFDRDAFDRISETGPDTAINAYFYRRNDSLDMDVPETFLLFFNRELIQRLRAKYGVGSAKHRWHTLPATVRSALESLSLGPDQMPEPHKPYFDTLRVLMMLSLVEGVAYRFVGHLHASPHASDEAFHVGGVSDPASTRGIWALRGSYFWYRVLEEPRFAELRRRYLAEFPNLTSQELLERDPETSRQIDDAFFNMCRRILEEMPNSARHADNSSATSDQGQRSHLPG
jgi:hypothetical protein